MFEGRIFEDADSSRTSALAVALFVTFLWSTSYVFIDVGLRELPALTFAGLRYGLATVVLLPVLVARGEHRALAGAGRRELGVLVGLGVTLYAITQGAQFLALETLRAATVGLVLTATPVVVALGGAVALDERPTRPQWVGIGLLLGGAWWYFGGTGGGHPAGLAIIGVGLLGNAAGAVLGRRANTGPLTPLSVTVLSMGVGSALLLGGGLAIQGLPALSARAWAIVGWLAVVNTALAFTLWNRALGTLRAVEASVVNNTMLVQIAVLGWLFLGQQLAPADWLALLVVAVGAILAGR